MAWYSVMMKKKADTPSSAQLARNRLSNEVKKQRRMTGSTRLSEQMLRDIEKSICDVIGKYVNVNRQKVKLNLDRKKCLMHLDIPFE